MFANNTTAELTMLIGIPTNEAKEQIKKHPVIAETKIRKSLKQFKAFHTFIVSY